jgi:epoxyqueuosine reductase
MSEANNTDRRQLSQWFRTTAKSLGFDLVGIAPIVPGLGGEYLEKWLAADMEGEMTYMRQHEEARRDPGRILEGARSVVMVGLAYRTKPPETAAKGTGRISRYAWGNDYHGVLRGRLRQWTQQLRVTYPEIRSRAVVDSAPLMERDYARLAGLGWFGKNTLLLHPVQGSWFFLGGLLVNVELDPDRPFETEHCGSCTRCLEACPTDAFLGPYQLDPRRCISYLTIEHKSSIPLDLRPGLENWVFGCDVCQEVCPWNRKVPEGAHEFAPSPGNDPVSLRSLITMTAQEFDRRYRDTPLFRTGRRRVIRNAILVAGNQRLNELQPELQTLARGEDELLSEAAQWALAQLEPPGDSAKP